MRTWAVLFLICASSTLYADELIDTLPTHCATEVVGAQQERDENLEIGREIRALGQTILLQSQSKEAMAQMERLIQNGGAPYIRVLAILNNFEPQRIKHAAMMLATARKIGEWHGNVDNFPLMKQYQIRYQYALPNPVPPGKPKELSTLALRRQLREDLLVISSVFQ